MCIIIIIIIILYQVGSNTQVLPDGVLILGKYRRLPDPCPLTVHLPHGILGDF